MITLKSFAFNPLQVNTYVLYDETLECIIIDASCYHASEFETLNDFIAKLSLKPVAVVNTHGHFDHLSGTKQICDKYKIDFCLHIDDQSLVKNATRQAETFGFSMEAPPELQVWIKDGDLIKFGHSSITAWHAPGHSPGSLIFYSGGSKLLITGDVLFAGSIGRTDLPGGNYQQLMNSINTKILGLPSDTKIFPGHGPATSLKEEIDFNPFLNKSS